MECIFALFILLLGAVWALDQYSKKNLDRRIDRASREGRAEELSCLIQIKIERQRKEMEAASQVEANRRYFDALLVLDAAENGVFLPDGERYFEALDQQDYHDFGYEEFGDDSHYYDDGYDPRLESEDHWGPV